MKRSTASKETKKKFHLKSKKEPILQSNVWEKYGYSIQRVKTFIKLNRQTTWGSGPWTLIRVWVSWKVRIVVQEIILQSKWQRIQGDFPIPSWITAAEVSDKIHLRYRILNFQLYIVPLRVHSPVTSAGDWVRCCIAGADARLSCCGICTRCFDFSWMSAYEVGRAVAQTSPDVQ